MNIEQIKQSLERLELEIAFLKSKLEEGLSPSEIEVLENKVLEFDLMLKKVELLYEH